MFPCKIKNELKTHNISGRRGDQKCEYKQWFVHQATKRMFMLHKTRKTYEEAQDVCEEDGAKLASFHDKEELRFVMQRVKKMLRFKLRIIIIYKLFNKLYESKTSLFAI